MREGRRVKSTRRWLCKNTERDNCVCEWYSFICRVGSGRASCFQQWLEIVTSMRPPYLSRILGSICFLSKSIIFFSYDNVFFFFFVCFSYDSCTHQLTNYIYYLPLYLTIILNIYITFFIF